MHQARWPQSRLSLFVVFETDLLRGMAFIVPINASSSSGLCRIRSPSVEFFEILPGQGEELLARAQGLLDGGACRKRPARFLAGEEDFYAKRIAFEVKSSARLLGLGLAGNATQSHGVGLQSRLRDVNPAVSALAIQALCQPLECRVDGCQFGRFVLVHGELFADLGGGLSAGIRGANIVLGGHVDTGDRAATLLRDTGQQGLACALERVAEELGLCCVHVFIVRK